VRFSLIFSSGSTDGHRAGFWVMMIMVSLLNACITQRADMSTDLSVPAPHYGAVVVPRVGIDAGHGNFHTLDGRFQPFATLLRNDGLDVVAHEGRFSANSLNGLDLLVIANAMVQEGSEDPSAFQADEITALLSWISEGGALLLIADHDPFGAASARLARVLGVEMRSVWTVDTLRAVPGVQRATWLSFTHDNQGLGSHPILSIPPGGPGIDRIISFTGQSLAADSTWTPILKLSSQARDYLTRDAAVAGSADPRSSIPAGESQMIAREYGKGRIVIAGEAAMFTAQEVRIFFKITRAGFNYPGCENKMLVLNTVHWLLSEKDQTR